MVIVADGTPEAAARLQRVLTTDPGMGGGAPRRRRLRARGSGRSRARRQYPDASLSFPRLDTMRQLFIDGASLTIRDVTTVAYAPERGKEIEVLLSDRARQQVERAATAVQNIVQRGEVVYGITTGFGAFKDRLIPREKVTQLQHNILMSHAVAVGPPLDQAATRAMMLIRANTLASGHSGIRPETLDLLLAMLNRGVYPVVPSQGSLGASGDLAPLAHMALPLIGLGEAVVDGLLMPGDAALARVGLEPVTLQAKEGLALTNGTTLMAAVGTLVSCHAENLAFIADLAGSLSLEALHGTPRAFDERIHAARPHPRQIASAAVIRQLIEGSQFTRGDDPFNVQDAYTLRCIPQVHGAVRDSIQYALWVLGIELNSATDNPLIFFDEQNQPTILSGGQLSRRAGRYCHGLPGPGFDRVGQYLGAPSHPPH